MHRVIYFLLFAFCLTSSLRAQNVKKEDLQKYLKGAVPEINEKVTFTKHFIAEGEPQDSLFSYLSSYLQALVQSSFALPGSKIQLSDVENGSLVARLDSWLTFRKKAFVLDRAHIYYTLAITCKSGRYEATISNIRYLYDVEEQPIKKDYVNAEDWITDAEALNKKGTKLLPISGKFRIKTIDLVQTIFSTIEQSVQQKKVVLPQ